ncbi:J domain-containing protein [Kribbella sp. NPDC050820]
MDPYEILGVAPTATEDDLDHAFRSLVRQLHPDTRTPSEPDPDADDRLHHLLNAYATLRDPIRRAAYDRTQTPPLAATARTHQPATTQPAQSRFEPAIRVGPVHWEPARQTTGRGVAPSQATRASDDIR